MTEPDISGADVSIESLIADAVLKEMDLTAARAEHEEFRETRKAIKDSITEEREKTATVIYQMREAILAEERALVERTAPLQESYSDMAGAEYDAAAAARKLQMELDSLQRQIDQMRRAQLKASEFLTLEARWDQMTMGAPWREWAKDHQLTGARKMCYEGDMILADTMGLGKTLTSLIAIDMIEAATKGASPENPVKFGSQD